MKPLNNLEGRKVVVGGLIGLFILTIVGYSIYAALPFLLGPSLTILETQSDGLTKVFGSTERVSYLSIDGAEIPLTETGDFSVTRAYPAGYTVLTAVARDRFSRSITKTLTFVVDYGTQK